MNFSEFEMKLDDFPQSWIESLRIFPTKKITEQPRLRSKLELGLNSILLEPASEPELAKPGLS
jgi:hypothetical protein